MSTRPRKEKPTADPQQEAQPARPAFGLHPLNVGLNTILRKQEDLPEAQRAQIGAALRSALYALHSKGTLPHDVPLSDLVNAVRLSASLNLHIGTIGRAELWLLPRRVKEKINGIERRTNRLIVQIGVQGYIKLAARSHRLAAAYQVTHEDIAAGRFIWDPLGGSSFTPNPVQYYLYGADDIVRLAGFVVVVKGGNLPTVLRWVNMKELDRHRAYSDGRGWSPWDTNPEAMYRNTALRIALKDEPFTFEGANINPFDEELNLDELSIDDYDDAPPPEPDGAIVVVDENGQIVREVQAQDLPPETPAPETPAPTASDLDAIPVIVPSAPIAHGGSWARAPEHESPEILSEQPPLPPQPSPTAPPRRRGRPPKKQPEPVTAD